MQEKEYKNKINYKLNKFQNMNTHGLIKHNISCLFNCGDFVFQTLNVARRVIGIGDEFDDIILKDIQLPKDSQEFTKAKERMMSYADKNLK